MPPSKRKSGEGAGASAAKSAKPDVASKVPVSVLLNEQVQRFDQWLFLCCTGLKTCC